MSKLMPARVRRSVRHAVLEAVESRVLFAGFDGSEINGLPADEKQKLYAWIGDHSASNSESYTMTVGSKVITAPTGVVTRDDREYKRGETYEITVDHTGTNRPEGEPDWDYRAWIARLANQTWTSPESTSSDTTFFVNNDSGLMQKRYFGDPEGSDPVDGKKAWLVLPAVDLDIDSDNSGLSDNTEVPQDTADDVLELDSSKGKLIGVTSGDLDSDDTPDLSDNDGLRQSFVPMTLRYSGNIEDAQPNSMQFRLNFNSSVFRVWKTPADEARTASDMVPANTPLASSDFDLEPGGEKTFFVEAIGAPGSNEAIELQLSVFGNVWSGQIKDKVWFKPFDVNFTKTYSDQLPNIAANYLAGSSGEQTGYILMGTRADNMAYGKADVQTTNIAADTPGLMFAFVPTRAIPEEAFVYDWGTTGTTWTLANNKLSLHTGTEDEAMPNNFIMGIALDNRPINWRIVTGVDHNGNGRLDSTEMVKADSREFKIVSEFHASEALERLGDVQLGFSGAGFSLSRAFLDAFIYDMPVVGATTSVPGTVAINTPGLTHNVGANFGSNGSGAVTVNNFNPTTGLSTAVLDSPEFIAIVSSFFDTKLAEVRNHFDTNPSHLAYQFTWQMAARNIEFPGFQDLNFAIHGGSLQNMAFTANVIRDQDTDGRPVYRLSGVNINGSISDLYDFNYEIDDPVGGARSGATYQAKFGVSNPRGHIFKWSVNWTGAVTRTYQYNWLANDPLRLMPPSDVASIGEMDEPTGRRRPDVWNGGNAII